MRVSTYDFFVPRSSLPLMRLDDFHRYYQTHLAGSLPDRHRAVRFVVTKTTPEGYDCEMDIIAPEQNEPLPLYCANKASIFDSRKRQSERTDKFTAVLLIPTGIGAEVGGHCGDGNTTARLLSSACDTLVTHPNVVNASDVNEMTENTLYVEGSLVTRLMTGRIGLQKSASNRMLLLADQHQEQYFNDEVINAVSTARVTRGIDCDIHVIQNPAESVSLYSKSGRAVGEVRSIERILDAVHRNREAYDAIALSTLVTIPESFHADYFRLDNDMVNPWGGIEAMLTHSIAETFDIPCAHSPLPLSESLVDFEPGIVDPRKAAETASVVYLQCILKGLHQAPRVVPPNQGLALEDISCLVIPDGCVGLPTLAAIENNIPVIAVRENKNKMQNDLAAYPFREDKLFIVENYWEAAGVMTALRAGVAPASVRRPISHTRKIL